MNNYLTQHSRTLKTEGIVALVLGVAAILLPVLFAIALEVFIGILLLLGGTGTAIRAYKCKGFPGSLLSLLGGILSAIIGLLFLIRPLEGVVTLTLLLAILFFVQGAIEIIMALQHRKWQRWAWMLWSGVASILIGGILIYGLPEAAAWALGVLVGIHLIFTGSWLWLLGTEIQKTAQ